MGDVRTKDVADALAHTAFTLIGEDAESIFDRLARTRLGATNLPTATLPAVDPDEAIFTQLGNTGRGRGGVGGGARRGPRRGGGGGRGRPNFGNRPNDR